MPYQGDEQRERTKKGLSIYTINIRLRNIKAIFRFLSEEGILTKNPSSNIPLVKDDLHEEVQGLTDKEIDMILASYDDKLFAQWQDKTLVLLLLDTGLRINEAMSLTEEHVDFQHNTLIVPSEIAKNRKQREIPISREITKRLKQLAAETEQYFGEGSRIFMNAYGDVFTADAFRKRLNRLKQKLNIPNLHPHMFRHTFARNYILNGGDVFTLQKILDHADNTLGIICDAIVVVIANQLASKSIHNHMNIFFLLLFNHSFLGSKAKNARLMLFIFFYFYCWF